jgi:hypothetical protein
MDMTLLMNVQQKACQDLQRHFQQSLKDSDVNNCMHVVVESDYDQDRVKQEHYLIEEKHQQKGHLQASHM